ncbi:hypothetical protein LEP1GSC050_0020 [Leptospira phage vB_LbrZ_5399-LE1]|uniref:Uncharacterized protein n=1 Tax=Leptospira inadai serovar Lyme TaxID=293084 RepID=A0ABX4YG91_9LEPT|nr:hypothetical protein LEP1GSC050_0020 [Leptospira phage vB_LbrZ_5399-LE1]AGS80846.1 hypothetical protein LEP1GSC047_0851 [Leptospira phage vB_LinZ_10-LE1]PNV74287.1 hypothetical protein BES34_013955 [Leptospira inadai serovar Lyme]
MNPRDDEEKREKNYNRFKELIESAISGEIVQQSTIELIFSEFEKFGLERNELEQEIFYLQEFIEAEGLRGDYFKFIQTGQIE